MAVTVIEMAGMVGSGKSTLASALRGDLERRGFRVFRVETAIAEVLDRSPVGSATRRLLGSTSSRRRALRATYKLAVRPWHTLRFVVHHPDLTRTAVAAVWRSPLPIGHRRRLLRLFLRPGAALLYFGPRLRFDEILVLEEGLVHRAVNLFAWSAAGVDREAVARYLAKLPRTDLVVLVAAPLAVCVERAGARGLPRRLVHGDDETTARFMRNAAEVSDSIADHLRAARRPSIVVDNSGSPAAAAAELRRAIEAHVAARHAAPGGRTATDRPPGTRRRGEAPSTPTTPRFDGGVRLPRPRRGRPTRRQPPRLTSDLVADVLAAFDLRAIGPVEPVSATSRADNVIVATSSGRRLVKRYKASVAEPAITHEHSVLRYLAALDFPSPRLTVAPDGATAHELAGRWYACFEYHPGFFHFNEYVWPPHTRRRLVGLSARALACLHVALADFTPVGINPNGFRSLHGRRVRDIEWYLDRVERARRYRGGGHAHGAAFRAMLDDDGGLLEKELRALDAELAAAALPRQVIHGDYGPYNLLFRRGERILILDFELARIDWRLTDVAKSLQQFGVNPSGLHLPRIARFVDEYERQRPLAAQERRLLPAVWLFLTLRRVAVCWDRYAESEDGRWLAEARRKLELAAMIRASADTLSTLGGRGGTRWCA